MAHLVARLPQGVSIDTPRRAAEPKKGAPPATHPEWLFGCVLIYSLYQIASSRQDLYINDVFIDEFTFIHWELQANLIPKFGYCSEKFDDVAWGKSLIQGQLAINFVSPGYLIGALMGKQVTASGSAIPATSDPAAAQQQPYQGSFSMGEVIAARARLLRRQTNRP